MISRGRDELRLSPGRLVVALAVIAFLAFVLPPYLARRLHQARVARATSQIRQVADALALASDSVLSNPALQGIEVLSGNGDPARGASDSRWTTAASASLQLPTATGSASAAADPWLRAVQVNVGARRLAAGVWVLSAGPNGLIETSFSPRPGELPGGDDIAVLLP